MMRRFSLGPLVVFALMIMIMSAQADTSTGMSVSQIKKEQRSCQQDQDCQMIRTDCVPCCADLSDSGAINKKYAKDYEGWGICTDAHIKSCGVPECGLESPTPVAVCRSGLCAAVMEFRGHVIN